MQGFYLDSVVNWAYTGARAVRYDRHLQHLQTRGPRRADHPEGWSKSLDGFTTVTATVLALETRNGDQSLEQAMTISFDLVRMTRKSTNDSR